VSGIPRPQTVPPIRLADLAALLPVSPVVPVSPVPTGPDVPVTGVTHASGEVRAGDLYAALPGARRHGAEFVGEAAAAGAVAVLTDAAGAPAAQAAGLPVLLAEDPRAVLGAAAAAVYGEPTKRLTMIGITGTAGKTSTAYLVESGLRAAGLTTGLIGTVETRLGDLVIDSVRTTPEATDLHAMLAAAAERGVTAVVMEVSSHALAMGRVGGVRFDVGGYTNFGLDHLDFHADAEDYFAAKARLFDGRCRFEVLNFDDPALRPLFRPATISYSAAGDDAATWWASGTRPSGFGQRFTAHGPSAAIDRRGLEVGVALPGRHNVANALLALAALVAAGVEPGVAAAGIAACPGVPGRLERVTAPGDVLGVVDYAHKPDAIVAALAALRELATARGGRLLCVIGAGGDRDTGKRPLMGAAAARGADVVVVTDDNPRTEEPAAVRAAVRAGAEQASAAAKIIEVAGRRSAIDEAVRLAGPGDVIAVLGKGHERGQEVNGEVLPFDDRIELAAALTARAPGARGGAA
jgi:UDP-N-acetylmuramoyl-L-alanyl-D-glutamate--2,6-diaminopimelate ligase